MVSPRAHAHPAATSRPTARRATAVALGVMAILVVLGALAGPATARAPKGIQDDERLLAGQSQAQRVRLLRDMRAAGARFVKIGLHWNEVAPTKPRKQRNPDDPRYNWATYDAVFAAARTANLPVFVSVARVPKWAGRVPAGAFDNLPRSASQFGLFVEAFATRYRTQRILRQVEVWNEPNSNLFGGAQNATGTPRRYAQMVQAATDALKRARASRLTVVAGAVAPLGNDTERQTRPLTFFANLRLPSGRRPAFEAISIHPYITSKKVPSFSRNVGPGDVDISVAAQRAAVIRSYVGRKPVWVSEFSVPTVRNVYNPYTFSPASQPRVLRAGFALLRRIPGLAGIAYYQMFDQPRTKGGPNAAWQSGLRTAGGAKKPSYRAFRAL